MFQNMGKFVDTINSLESASIQSNPFIERMKKMKSHSLKHGPTMQLGNDPYIQFHQIAFRGRWAMQYVSRAFVYLQK